jgi:peptide/nickel transport system substrate-binding protein
MKKRVATGMMLTLIILSMITFTFDVQRAESVEPPATEWTKIYGGSDYDGAYSVVQTVDGGYALAGYTDSFGAGNEDFWIVKVDSSGNHQWNKTYGGNNEDVAFSVVQTLDGGYALAGCTAIPDGPGDVMLVKVAGSARWTVDDDGPADFHTIQEAINAANPRDTIYVYNGTYHENVVVNKALTLTGEDRSNTIINGSGLQYLGALVTIEPDNVDFAGFTVTDALNEGIIVEASQHCEVLNNIVCFTGDRGIRLEGGGNNTVYNNIVYNSSAYGGIEAINSDNNTIYNNLAYFNQWGIATNHGSYNHIYNNTVYSNWGTGIHIDWPSTGNIVSSNNVSSNTEIGICVMNQASKTVIEGNKISGSFWGINLENSLKNSISGNTITTNTGGIGLHLSSNNSLTGNDMTNNEIGIFLNINSNNNSICRNTITTNYNNSIVLVYSSMNTISENTITNNYNGIQVHDSSNFNTISGNTITSNECGIQIRASNQNRFFHNNFKYNTKQVNILAPSCANFWDDGYPSGGNYWSDYMGLDFYSGLYQNETGSDEIGDMAYVIDEDNQDRYPLVKPWQVSIIIGTTDKITVLDPAKAYDFCTWEVSHNIGEGLLKYKPGTTELVYGIAENYTVSHDASNYTFKLREGMYFTDGEPLNATAVKWSIDRVMNLSQGPVYMVSDYVDSVEVLDTLTVKFVLKKPGAYFPALVATPTYFPVSSKSYPANETAEPTVGHYGPYRIKSWTRDMELILEANPDYYGTQPRSKYIIIRFLSNSTEMRQALEDGEIDIAWRTLPPTDIVSLKENPNFDVVEAPESIIRFIVLRCNMTPFDDVRLRQAVAASINRTRICTEAYTDTVEPLYSMVPRELWSHVDAFKEEYGVRNLTLARELLTAAGYSEEEKFGFDLWYPLRHYGDPEVDVAAIIKSDLEETGMIEVTLKSAEWTTYLANMQTGVMPIFLLGWIPDFLDPGNYLTPFLYSEWSPYFGVFYNNTVMDDYLEDALVELNVTRRTELYEDAQRLLADDAPLVPFFQGTLSAVTRPNIEGVYLSPTMFLPYYTIYKHTPSTQYPWPMFHQNLRHTGYTESPALNTNQTMWNYTTGSPIWSSPVVADGKVFVQSGNGKIYCLDAITGAQIWNYTPTYTKFARFSPTVADGKVYVGSHSIYCLDASTGAQIWNYTTGPFVDSSPAIANGKVYIGSDDNNTYCLDASTGAHIWNYTTGDDVYSSPAVADGKVYVGSYDGNVYCLDASTGAHIWNHTAGDSVRSSPAVADGKVYVGSYDGNVYCLNASTGSHIWNYTTGDRVSSSPAVADGKIYVGSHDHNVYCLDALTGGLIWNYTTGDRVWSSPAVADGMLFIGSDDGIVYAFGNIIRVPEDYPTVQEAIDAADEGATIIVAPGIYYESLVINKTVTIIGEPGSVPIFDGGGSGTWVTLLPGASGSTITNVVITNWDLGISIVDSSNCKIYDNIMSLMDYSGITLEGNNAANNIIYNNIFQGNTIAINLTESSTNNLIYKNTISGNDIGIDMTNSNTNIIYHNNFVNNAFQIDVLTSTENIWDNGYPSGGNYWSDYETRYPAAQEIGDSGIWDTPYEIDENNIDYYPLIKPFSGIGITDVTPSKTIIGQGFTLHVNLKILNYGVHDQDSTVTVYANSTVLAKQTNSLTRMNSTTVTFLWDTTSVVKGNYTIKATATSVLGETDLSDNTLIDGWIIVTIIGDVNADGKVNVKDIFAVAKAFGSEYPDPKYNPNLDINCDGKINVKDIFATAKNFGKEDP